MAYKHEKSLKSRLLDLEFDTWEEVHQFKREYDELEEVYIKAKAFNEIVEVFKDYPLKTDSDVMDFIQAKLDDMEDE